MFIYFFYYLRKKGIPVSTIEFLDFIKVLDTITYQESYLTIDQLYRIGRSCLVKDIKFYDFYDIAFGEIFGSITNGKNINWNQIYEWLENAKKHALDSEKIQNAPYYETQKLFEELEKRIREQKERHEGGDTWIGTNGTSPYGNCGYNQQGIRIGGVSQNRTAIAVWSQRNYRPYRTDEVLDIRKLQIALRYLRIFKKEGNPELNIPKTIQKTAENSGDIELVMEKARKNNLKLALIMDIGGSMTPHTKRVSLLFSAANKIQHFREFYTFYFHNIFTKELYYDPYFKKPIPLKQFTQKLRKDTRLIFVGDAWMAPYELFHQPYNPYFYRGEHSPSYYQNFTGMEALQFIRKNFPYSVWLNPEPYRLWGEPTIEAISSVIPMYYLSLDGIRKAIQHLLDKS